MQDTAAAKRTRAGVHSKPNGERHRGGRWPSRYLNRCVGLAGVGCNFVTHICPNETRDSARRQNPL